MIQSIPFLKKAWITAQVEKIIDYDNGIRHIWVQPNKEVNYQPGQNITISIPLAKNESEQQRTFSIANAPQANGQLELCLSYIAGGKASQYLFHSIRVGSVIEFRGPHGQFVLPQKIETDLVFICMGAALAPACSMIQYIFQQDIQRKKIHLIYGVRSTEGLLCSDEFTKLAIQYKEFKYSYTLSKEKISSSTVRRKNVHDIYLDQYQNPRKDILFYISGSPSLIEEILENLMGLGYRKNQIVYDIIG